MPEALFQSFLKVQETRDIGVQSMELKMLEQETSEKNCFWHLQVTKLEANVDKLRYHTNFAKRIIMKSIFEEFL